MGRPLSCTVAQLQLALKTAKQYGAHDVGMGADAEGVISLYDRNGRRMGELTDVGSFAPDAEA